MNLSDRKNFSEFAKNENFSKEKTEDNQNAALIPIPYWILVLVKPYLYMILTVGIGGNSYIILYFLRSGQLKRIASLKFMTALAVADLIYLITLACHILFEQLLQIAINDVSCKLNTYLIYLR